MNPENQPIDLSEKGRDAAGKTITLNKRLFIQFLAYGSCPSTGGVIAALNQSNLTATLYLDMNDPRGIGLAVAHESPDFFVTELREFLNRPPFNQLVAKPEYTMLGRTYSVGYEADLEHVLIRKPVQRLCNPALPWAVWYPLRRAGAFEKLSAQDQKAIMSEHGNIGATFTTSELGYDIRLACHGLDKNDNDFVIGLIGKELHPLSAMVQTMRKTRQTSEFLTNLGPFFVGKAIWQSKV